MQKVFLVSSLGASEQINGVKKPKPINDCNGLKTILNSKLEKRENFVFMASNPSDYQQNDLYAQRIFTSFQLSKMPFKNLIIIDERSTLDLKEVIMMADLVFLAGGHTLTEMQYFEKIKLRALLKDYSGVILGQSAGALNLAKTVVCAPEYVEEIGAEYLWPGLGKTWINIEPHFNLEVNSEADKLLREELLKVSVNNPLYALPDGSFVFDDGLKAILYGEAYYLDGKITKICQQNEFIVLNNQGGVNENI